MSELCFVAKTGDYPEIWRADTNFLIIEKTNKLEGESERTTVTHLKRQAILSSSFTSVYRRAYNTEEGFLSVNSNILRASIAFNKKDEKKAQEFYEELLQWIVG